MFEIIKKCNIKSKAILEDNRFKIDLDFFQNLTKTSVILDYEIKNIKLKDIKRSWKNKTIRLNKTHPYLYLQGHVKQYEKYCIENKKLSNFEMSKARFDNLIKDITENSFNELYMPIINSQTNVILDGQHRCCVLYHLYGENYTIQCISITIVPKKYKYTLWQQIFSIRNAHGKQHKILTILGFKLKFRRK